MKHIQSILELKKLPRVAGNYVQTYKWLSNNDINVEVNKFKIIKVNVKKRKNSWKSYITYKVIDSFGGEHLIMNTDIKKDINKTNFEKFVPMSNDIDPFDTDNIDDDEVRNKIKWFKNFDDENF